MRRDLSPFKIILMETMLMGRSLSLSGYITGVFVLI
jgi:hypothetical protein